MAKFVRLTYIANFVEKGYSTYITNWKELQKKINVLQDLEKTNISITEIKIDRKNVPIEEIKKRLSQ